MPENPASVGLLVQHTALRRQAGRLAERYKLPLLASAPEAGYYLYLGDRGLELRQGGTGAPGPVRIEFAAGAMAHRLRFGGGRGQPLARAMGMKPGFNPEIFDATAGLGRDAFVLASLGSRVTLCERSAALAALLEDGLYRAQLDADIGSWVQQRMSLCFGDARRRLAELPSAQRPDVVYLDPMYPPGKSGVLVKKDMRALQQLLGADSDADMLLETARACARRRVVVKRPKRAGWLADAKPDTAIESKKTRYDIYVTL